MAKVQVHQVGLYNVITDNIIISRRMATPEGAQKMNGWIIENTAIEIDDSDLEKGEQWTAVGFRPNRRAEFQTQVSTSPSRF